MTRKSKKSEATEVDSKHQDKMTKDGRRRENEGNANVAEAIENVINNAAGGNNTAEEDQEESSHSTNDAITSGNESNQTTTGNNATPSDTAPIKGGNNENAIQATTNEAPGRAGPSGKDQLKIWSKRVTQKGSDSVLKKQFELQVYVAAWLQKIRMGIEVDIEMVRAHINELVDVNTQLHINGFVTTEVQQRMDKSSKDIDEIFQMMSLPKSNVHKNGGQSDANDQQATNETYEEANVKPAATRDSYSNKHEVPFYNDEEVYEENDYEALEAANDKRITNEVNERY